MKPFDINKALAGESVVNGDGKKIEFIAYDSGSPFDCCVMARAHGMSAASLYSLTGKLLGVRGSEFDLFMAPPKREGWVNVFPGGLTGGWHATKEIADKFGVGRLACIRIEWEELL